LIRNIAEKPKEVPSVDKNALKQIILSKISHLGTGIASRGIIAVAKQIINESTIKLDQYVIEDMIKELSSEGHFKLNKNGRRFAMDLPLTKPDEKYILDEKKLRVLWENMSTILSSSNNSAAAANLLINSYGEWGGIDKELKSKMAAAAVYQLIENGTLV
jgi:hypothetical protein